jgi:hypothetical protein
MFVEHTIEDGAHIQLQRNCNVWLTRIQVDLAGLHSWLPATAHVPDSKYFKRIRGRAVVADTTNQKASDILCLDAGAKRTDFRLMREQVQRIFNVVPKSTGRGGPILCPPRCGNSNLSGCTGGDLDA